MIQADVMNKETRIWGKINISNFGGGQVDRWYGKKIK